MFKRVVEAYIGEYASGKSELAINRALDLCRDQEPVTLVDLDFVEPFYTLRPLKAYLEGLGLTVIGWGAGESFGLGETGVYVKPAARWALWRPGHIILDVGYGVHGAASLNLVEGAWESSELKVLAVINASRPMTSSVSGIVDYVRSLGRVDGIINNTHLGDETSIEVVLEGLHLINEAAKIVEIPLLHSTIVEKLKDETLNAGVDPNKVKTIKRYMPAAMW
ncbi:MAG: hypothetical protein ACM3MK_00095 [Chitinophagales bacterium]